MCFIYSFLLLLFETWNARASCFVQRMGGELFIRADVEAISFNAVLVFHMLFIYIHSKQRSQRSQPLCIKIMSFPRVQDERHQQQEQSSVVCPREPGAEFMVGLPSRKQLCCF